MQRFVLALVIVLALTAGASASSKPTRKSGNTQAKALVHRMIVALHRQGRIQAGGTVRGKGRPTTTYLLRYQATGREDYRATLARKKGSTTASAGTSLHYILIGSDTYSFVASRWYKVRSASTPDAVDVLSLSTDGALCCTSTGIRTGENVTYVGKLKWHGAEAYVISYRGAVPAGGAYGRIYLATGSYLPRAYSVHTSPLKTAGLISLKYGGSFNISSPHT